MDPAANRREQLELAQDIIRTWNDCNADGSLTDSQAIHVSEQAQRLADLVEALHDWDHMELA